MLCSCTDLCNVTECALEDDTFEDGAETQVDCNRCVCACGNWVCTAMICDGEITKLMFLSCYKGNTFDYIFITNHIIMKWWDGLHILHRENPSYRDRWRARDDRGGVDPPCCWTQQASGELTGFCLFYWHYTNTTERKLTRFKNRTFYFKNGFLKPAYSYSC